MPQLNSLQDLFIEGLQDLYDAENQITKALPMMAQAASSPELKQGFEAHLQQTQTQIERLNQIFQTLGASPTGKTCKAMQGLIQEGQELMSMQGAPSVLDAGLIAAAQRVEHYEMAGYGTARTWAQILGQQEAADLLQQTLQEEEMTDKQLTQLAESMVNPDAAQS